MTYIGTYTDTGTMTHTSSGSRKANGEGRGNSMCRRLPWNVQRVEMCVCVRMCVSQSLWSPGVLFKSATAHANTYIGKYINIDTLTR